MLGYITLSLFGGSLVKIIVPTEIDIEVLPEISKLANGQKYVRRGANRRQDHGTRGNVLRNDIDVEEWKISANKRRDFRATGRQITGTF